MPDLHLALKGEYFDAIKAGTKTEEYRLCTPYWGRRIGGKRMGHYDRIVLTHGYPAKGDESRRLVLPWRGYTIKTITHPHFGTEPVQVYAINVQRDEDEGRGAGCITSPNLMHASNGAYSKYLPAGDRDVPPTH